MRIVKAKATRKELYNRYGKENILIIPFSFNRVQSLFTPSAYTCGVYGWNCDVYFGRTYLYTYGYSPIGSKSSIADEQTMINTMREDGVPDSENYWN